MQEQTEQESEGDRKFEGESVDPLPEASVGHLCGSVGVNGVISDAAMRNFLARVFLRIERFLKVSVGEDSAEFGVSIAIFPVARKRIEIEPFAGTFAASALDTLREMIEGVPIPVVQDGPFACVVYRRWNQSTPTISKLSAFPSLSQDISSWGLEEALRRFDSSGQLEVGKGTNVARPRGDAHDASWETIASSMDAENVESGRLLDGVGTVLVGVGENPSREDSASDASMGGRLLRTLGAFFDRLHPKFKRVLKSLWDSLFRLKVPPAHVQPPIPKTGGERKIPEFSDQEVLLGRIAEQAEQSTLEELQQIGASGAAKASDRLALAIKYTELQQWNEAEQALTHAIEVLPPMAVLHAYRAKLHRVRGESAAALADLNLAIELAPEQVAIRADRAELYGELSAWQAAESDLETVVTQSPREPDYLMRFSESKVRLEKYGEAAIVLRELLAMDPNHGPAHNLLGWILHEHHEDARREALFHFGEAVEIVPQEIGPRIYRCLIYLAENKLALADEECQAILKLDPDSPPALGLRGRILQMEGEYEEAIESCTRALDSGFETSLVLLARALSYANLEQFEAAMRDCQATLQAEPNLPLAHYLLGQLHLQEGDLDAAEEAFLKSAELGDRDWTEPREKLALIQRMRENPEAAVETHTTLIRENPGQVSNYVNRALAYAEAGQFQLAENDFREALQMEPENERIYMLRGHYWNQRQEYERALFDFDQALTLTGDDDGARYNRALVLVSLRKHEEAIGDYEVLIKKYPDDPRAYAGRCYVLAMIGEEVAAESDLQRAGELDPDQSERLRLRSLVGRAGYLIDQEEYDQAEELAKEIAQQYPEEAIGFRVKGYVHWCREEYVEAIDEYSAALEFSENASLLSARGQLRGEIGEYEAALVDLDTSVRLSRKEGERLTLAYALNGRAMVYAAQDRWEEAERDFEESILLSPSNPWVHYHRGVALYRRKALGEARIVLDIALGLSEPMLPTRKRERAKWILAKLESENGD